MINDDLNQIRGVIKEEIGTALKPVNDKLGVLDNKVGCLDKKVGDLDKTVGDLDKKVATIDNRVRGLDKKVGTLWDQTVKLTEDMTEARETLNSHTAVLKQIARNTEQNKDSDAKLDKRLHILEDQSGIVPPPELTII